MAADGDDEDDGDDEGTGDDEGAGDDEGEDGDVVAGEVASEEDDEAEAAFELFEATTSYLDKVLPLIVVLEADEETELMLGAAVYSFGQKKTDYANYYLEMVLDPAEAEAFI